MPGRQVRDYLDVIKKVNDKFKNLLFILLLLISVYNLGCSYADDLTRSFIEPPEDARPMTWWHWMSGNVTKEGITRDLEAMEEAGIGGALIFSVTEDVPKGPVDFNSPEFHNLIQHAIRECDRLGLKFGIHNCDGWSSSGGPWVQPKDSMKIITDSQIFVTGPQKIHIKLPDTYTNLEYSKDISVLAYPSTISEQNNMYSCNPQVKAGKLDGKVLVDGDAGTFLYLPRPSQNNPPTVEIIFDKPFEANGFTVTAGGISQSVLDSTSFCTAYQIELWISGDSDEYVKQGDMYQVDIKAPQTFDFKSIKAKRFQFRFVGSGGAERVPIAEIALHNTARLKEYRKLSYQNTSWANEIALTKNEMIKGDDFTVNTGDIIDITNNLNKEGELDWQAPPGQWTIVRLAATTNARRNVPASDEGRGLEVDKLSKDAVDRFWDGFVGKIIDRASDKKAFKVLEVDSWEVGFQNWTDQMLDTFRSRRGYDLKPYLLALTGRIVNTEEQTKRFLWDYRQTISEIATDNYIRHMAEKAGSHGITFYNEPYHGPFDSYEFGGSVHVPMGEFWDTAVWGNRMHTCKLAACIAHSYGKKIVSAEAFTTSPESAGWQNHPYSLKALGDEAFCNGINEMVFHRFTHQAYPNIIPGMTMGKWGAHIDRTQTWWKPAAKAWMTYLARCQYMLRQGRFSADIAYYTGQQHSNNDLGYDHLRLNEHLGYDYDMFSKEILLKAKVEDGQLELPSGMRYRILVLPKDNYYMTLDVAAKIAELVRDGATVIGPRPKASPSLSNYPADDKKIMSIADAVWGSCDGKSVKQNRFGKGMVIDGKSLKDVLSVMRDFDYKSDSKAAINFIHRKLTDGDLYFVASKEQKAVNATCVFRVTGKIPEVWDPVTGKMCIAPVWRQMKDCTEVDIIFPESGSFFILFRENSAAGEHITDVAFKPLKADEKLESIEVAPFVKDTTAIASVFTDGDLNVTTSDGRKLSKSIRNIPSAIELNGPWTVQFPHGSGASQQTVFKDLISWTESSDFNIKHFSGTATYKKQFIVPKEYLKDDTKLYLDFGTVHEIAEVSVNGSQFPVIWKPPFRLDVTKSLKAGVNHLEVKVTNLWPNRLIGDEYYPEDFESPGPKGALSKIPEWVIENKSRSEQRRKTFVVYRHWTKDDPLLPSGLFGPVRVVPAKVVNFDEQFTVLTESSTKFKSDQGILQKLEIAGVTPYSNMQTPFYDEHGNEYPNFIELAHHAGVNSVRLIYEVGEDKAMYYQQANEAAKLGLRVVCTIIPSRKEYGSFAEALKGIKVDYRDAVADLKKCNLTPYLITLGNEVNCKHGHLNKWSSWSTQEGDFMSNIAKSLKKAAMGVRDAGFKGDIAVHIDRSWGEFFTGIQENGFTDYQVVAISLYPKWGDSKTTVEQKVEAIIPAAQRFDKKVLVLETGAPYIKHDKARTQDFDRELVTEISPLGQRKHLEHVCGLISKIPNGRGMGVLTWGSDITKGIHKWDQVTWNRAQVTRDKVALPSLYVFAEYAEDLEKPYGVDVWQTKISDGDAKRAFMGEWDGVNLYDVSQDNNFMLFRKERTELLPGNPGRQCRIILDASCSFQEMLGYGASMTDSAAFVLMKLREKNPRLYSYTMKKLFDPEEGAGFSFLRKPLGSSDYVAAENYYTYCDNKSDNLSEFSIDHDKKYIIPVIKEALRLNPSIKLMGSPWSPPAWMKTNESFVGVSAEEKKSGNSCRLKPEYFEVYADYFIKFIEAYKNEGIEFYAITLQNEPQFDMAKYPCMRMSASDQIKLIKILGPKLKQNKLQTRIFIHDHNWKLHSNDTRIIGGDVKRRPIDLCKMIMQDPEAGQYVAGTAWHCYSGGYDDMKKAYTEMYKEFPEKMIFCTEATGWGINRGRWFGDVNWGMQHNWMGGPANYSAASLQWNLALDHQYGPTLRDDSQAMGLVTINTDSYQEVKFEREFYPMAQMSRAVKTGSVRIKSYVMKGNSGFTNLKTIAFRNQDRELSLVVYNDTAEVYDFQTESGDNYFVNTIQPRTIATFVWGE